VMSFPAFITPEPLFREPVAVVATKVPRTSYAAEPAFGNRFLRERSYTISSIFLTLYLMLSLLRLNKSFFKFRIWKPAWRSFTNWLICRGRS
jgi:hypothetical protein